MNLYTLLLSASNTSLSARDMAKAGDNGVLAMIVFFSIPVLAWVMEFLTKMCRFFYMTLAKKELTPELENRSINSSLKDGAAVSVVSFNPDEHREFVFSRGEGDVFYLDGNRITCEEMLFFLAYENARMYRM